MLQLFLAATIAALLLGLFTSAWRAGVPANVTQVRFSPNGKLLAARFARGTVKIWSLADKRPRLIAHAFQRPVLPREGNQHFYESIFFLDGSRLIKISDGLVSYSMSPVRVREFDLSTGKTRDALRIDFSFAQEHSAGAAGNRLYLSDWSHDGKTIFCFDIKGGVLERELASTPQAIYVLALSKDGRRLAAIDKGGTLTVFDTATGDALCSVPVPGAPLSTAAGSWIPLLRISADGTRIIVRGQAIPGSPAAADVSAFNIPSGSHTALPIASQSGIAQISISDDASVIAVNHDSGVECYQIASAKRLCQIPDFQIQSGLDYIQIAPDGKSLATYGGEQIILWDVATGKLLYELGGNSRMSQASLFVIGFAVWAVFWGTVGKRGRASLAKSSIQTANGDRQGVPTPYAPLAMKLCWGLMIVGGLVALGIPIVLMFTVGPWLFPTIYFSLFVGLAATARGASRDCIHLQRTAALQLANMIALDPANVVFAAMELALLRSQTVKNYLSQAEQRSGGL